MRKLLPHPSLPPRINCSHRIPSARRRHRLHQKDHIASCSQWQTEAPGHLRPCRLSWNCRSEEKIQCDPCKRPAPLSAPPHPDRPVQHLGRACAGRPPSHGQAPPRRSHTHFPLLSSKQKNNCPFQKAGMLGRRRLLAHK